MNPAVEYRARLVSDNAAKSFIGRAVWHCMFNTRVIVRMFLPSQQIHTVQLTVGAMTLMIDHDIDPLEFAPKGDVEAVERCVPVKGCMQTADVQRFRALEVKSAMVQRSACRQN